MKKTITKILATLAFLSIVGCGTLTPQQTAAIQTTANVIAIAAQVAAPMTSNKQLSNDLYAVGSVAGAYASGNLPVPTTVLQATVQAPQIAGVVLPLVTGKQNSAQTVALINGAAQILAATQGKVVTSGSTGN